MLSMTLTEKIKKVRKERRLSQADVAVLIDTDKGNYHRLETRGDKLSIDQTARIAEAFGMTLIELLLYGEGGKTDEPISTEETDRLKEEVTQLRGRVEELKEQITDKKIIQDELKKRVELMTRINLKIFDYIITEIADKAKAILHMKYYDKNRNLISIKPYLEPIENDEVVKAQKFYPEAEIQKIIKWLNNSLILRRVIELIWVSGALNSLDKGWIDALSHEFRSSVFERLWGGRVLPDSTIP